MPERRHPAVSVDLVAAYHQLLEDDDDAVRWRAADDWCAWEDAVIESGGERPAEPARTPIPASGWRSHASSPTTSTTVPGSTTVRY